MNRAHQHALFQQTNQGLLGIRQSEINYYLNLFNAFGTRAVLIGGFTYGTFTQNDVEYTNPYLNVFTFIYFVLSALTIAASVHIMLCTMVLQVFGPGLALNGPLGSMSRATEGMRTEQDQIVISFVFMIFCFALSCVAQFWMVMTFIEATTSSGVFLIAAYYWYYYSERIYLRFYWDKSESAWKDNERDIERGDSYSEPGASKHATIGAQVGEATTYPKFPTKETAVGSAPFHHPSTSPLHGGAVNGDTGFAMEGYLTVQGRSERQVNVGHGSSSRSRSSTHNSRWERYYCAVLSNGDLYFYRNRQEFRLDPNPPIYTRGLKLSDFHVYVDNKDKEFREGGGETTSTKTGQARSILSAAETSAKATCASASMTVDQLRFQITLIPLENGKGISDNAANISNSGDNSCITDPHNPSVRFDNTTIRNSNANDYSDSNDDNNNSKTGKPLFRNHWHLRCDTEEQLDLWVNAMYKISPQSFRKLPLSDISYE